MTTATDRLPDWAQKLADMGAEVHTLDTLQHSEAGSGPWKLYIYRPDGYHSGGKWFRKGKMEYPDEEIALSEAETRAHQAIKRKHEVRVCDGGDMLVFHSANGKTIHGENFWTEVAK